MNWLQKQFEISRGGSAHNVRPMEGLRGFAVFLVFLVHYATLVSPWLNQRSAISTFSESLHAIGNTGVDLFFVLSGYLIYGSLISRKQPFARFFLRRIQRIYPAFTVVFLTYVVLSFAFPAERKIPANGLDATLYLIGNFLLLPGMFPMEPMITVAWSLSYEMFYYLAIPFLIVILGLRERQPFWRNLFFLTLSVLITAYCLAFTGHIRLIMFIAGIVLYEAMDSPSVPAPSSLAGLAALAAGLLAMLIPVHGSTGWALKMNILFASFFIVCLACFRTPLAWLPRAFSWTPLRWLGNMSYSYYLLHGLALKASFLAIGKVLPPEGFGAWFFWTLLPLTFLVTVVPSAALFLLIERPFSLTPKTAR